MRKYLPLLFAVLLATATFSLAPVEAKQCRTNRCVEQKCAPKGCCNTCGKPDCSGCRICDVQDQVCTRLFKVIRQAPESGVVDEELPICIDIHALKDVSDVVVREALSCHATILRTDPEAEINEAENEVVWKFECMDEKECKTLRLWVSTENVGDICDCITVDALPRLCATTFIGKCNLTMEGCGPECLCLCESGNYSFKICNNGTACARDVVATCMVPPGMCHESGQSEVCWRLGNMDCNCTETVALCLEVKEPGNHCVVAKAVAANHCDISDNVCTVVQQPNIACSCSAMEKQFVGKEAVAAITVTNTGDMEQCDVVVTDDITPCDIDIVDAAGGCIQGSRITWELGAMEAGASKTLDVTVHTCCPCEVHHAINVRACNPCCPCDACCECSTCYIGHPGLLIEMIDTCDPMLVGEESTYRIRVTNQGTAADTNVHITAMFPEELEPTSACGTTEGQVSGQTVTFAPYPELIPGQSIQYTVEAKAKAKGDGRVKVELNSDLLKSPVTEEESTYIY